MVPYSLLPSVTPMPPPMISNGMGGLLGRRWDGVQWARLGTGPHQYEYAAGEAEGGGAAMTRVRLSGRTPLHLAPHAARVHRGLLSDHKTSAARKLDTDAGLKGSKTGCREYMVDGFAAGIDRTHHCRVTATGPLRRVAVPQAPLGGWHPLT